MAPSWLHRNASRLVAIAICTGLFLLSRPPTLTSAERADLASRFRFTSMQLPDVPGVPKKYIRRVHPRVHRIAAWISSLGAAAALHDLDGDGLPNDVCYVDPRTDLAIVTPVPGTGPRYATFALDHGTLPWDETMAPTGCLPGDFNEDGRPDILVYMYGRTPIVYLNDGVRPLSPGSFRPQELTRSGERWFTNAATAADFDGDGHLDLFIGNYFQDGSHMLNPNGQGTATMHDAKSKSYNGGLDHFFVWEGGTDGDSPTVSFREAHGVIDDNLSRQWALAAGAMDIDGDMLPELYVGNDLGPDQLLHNVTTRPGSPRFVPLKGMSSFTTPASYVLGEDSFKGMGTDFGDLNGDGMLDIYVSNIARPYGFQEAHLLWLSTGDAGAMARGYAPYVQASDRLGLSQSGWGWDSRLVDFDNDGVLEALQALGFIKGTVNRWPEVQALGTGNDKLMADARFWPRIREGDDISGNDANAFFVRAADGRFYDIAPDLGIDDRSVTRALAVADVDGDGDMDFVCGNQWMPSRFFRNESPLTTAGPDARPRHAFLGLHLLLPIGGPATEVRVRSGHPGPDTPGRPAVGAVVRVRMPDGRTLVSQVDGGSGHSGKRSPDVHLGLGAVPADTVLPVSLTWRDAAGTVQDTVLQLTPGWHTITLRSAR